MTADCDSTFESLRTRFNKGFICDYDEMARVVAAHRELERSIVLTSGTFDMPHVGHCRYLQHGKELGDILIVGVDSDDKVRAKKGPKRPLDKGADRPEMPLHWRWVDHVFVKEVDHPRWGLIKVVKPDVLLATQGSYTDEEVQELETKYCGKVVVLEPQATTSTTARVRLLLIEHGTEMIDQLDSAIVNVEAELTNLKEFAHRFFGRDNA